MQTREAKYTMVQKNPKHMVLTTFMLPAGYHKDSWRREGSRVEELPGLDFVLDLTLMAERAKLDAVFFGDIAHANTVLRGDIKMNGFFEPISTLAALAARTSHIGLIGTVSTSFENPYTLARQIAGIDHMSGGRAGWNLVTSSDGYQNYGKEMPDPELRYRRALEFADLVRALWDSWSDDAVIVDRETGEYADLSKIRKVDHSGEFYSVEGPLPGPRSPQGQPIIVVASSSDAGLPLVGRHADGVYTVQPQKSGSLAAYERVKEAVAGAGRNPAHTKVLPGILPILGDTQQEADELAEELAGYVNLEFGRTQVGADLKMSLGELEFDETIPAEWFSDDPKLGSRYAVYKRKSIEQNMTLRELIVDLARSTGHQWVAGTPSKVADIMVDWFDSGACDGFNLNSPFNPGGFQLICDKLVPELQSRGYFREEYEGTTLRDNLGLDRPAA